MHHSLRGYTTRLRDTYSKTQGWPPNRWLKNVASRPRFHYLTFYQPAVLWEPLQLGVSIFPKQMSISIRIFFCSWSIVPLDLPKIHKINFPPSRFASKSRWCASSTRVTSCVSQSGGSGPQSSPWGSILKWSSVTRMMWGTPMDWKPPNWIKLGSSGKPNAKSFQYHEAINFHWGMIAIRISGKSLSMVCLDILCWIITSNLGTYVHPVCDW